MIYDNSLVTSLVIATIIIIVAWVRIYASAERSPADWWAGVSAITTVFASIVAVFALFAIRGQVDEMRLEQRPWVYGDAEPGGQFYRNQSGGFSILIKFTFHNTGHLPALYTWPAARIYLRAENNKTLDLQREACKKRQEEETSPTVAGNTVFPGQDLSVAISPDGDATKDKWDAALASRQNIGVSPLVVGCIDYQIPGETPKHHTTGFAFFVGRRSDSDPTGFYMLPADPTTVPLDHLVLMNWIEGGASAAD